MATHNITAMYQTKAEADAAAAAIRADSSLHATNVRVLPEDGTEPGGAGARREEGGFMATLRNFFMPEEDRYGYAEGLRRGQYMVGLDADESQAHRVMDLLEQHGAVDMDAEEARWRAEGWKGYEPGTPYGERDTTSTHGMTSTGAGGGTTSTLGTGAAGLGAGTAGVGTGTTAVGSGTTGVGTGTTGVGATGRGTGTAGTGVGGTGVPGLGSTAAGTSTTGTTRPPTGRTGAGVTGTGRETEEVIPLVEEQLRVGKRQVIEGRVRIRSYVVEQPVSETVRLREEHVQVERRPVDRPISEATGDPFREREFEATEMREEPVVSKDARVREELVMRKTAEERDETVKDTVRRTEVREDRDGDTDASGKVRDPNAPRRP